MDLLKSPIQSNGFASSGDLQFKTMRRLVISGAKVAKTFFLSLVVIQ
jgi:hypothetical protein